MSKYCSKCGTQCEDSAEFCHNCGSTLIKNKITSLKDILNNISEAETEIQDNVNGFAIQLDTAKKFVSIKHWNEAEIIYKELSKKHPNDYRLWEGYADYFKERGDFGYNSSAYNFLEKMDLAIINAPNRDIENRLRHKKRKFDLLYKIKALLYNVWVIFIVFHKLNEFDDIN